MPTLWHFTTWLDLFDHWQTLAAGVLAVLAAILTILQTRSSAKREIAASKEQTDVARQQVETTLRLEQRRIAREGYAFSALLEAAMARVLSEVAEARGELLPSAARQCFTKSAFSELRSACVRQGGRLTADFLNLECEIDSLASSFIEVEGLYRERLRDGVPQGLTDQLSRIEIKASHLREEATAGMQRANALLAESESVDRGSNG
ncbi:MAG TPA: hypothetical protein VMI72_11700 [Roseiarcus sp.]|nr:hypothetical protein [Roseiarcus sp.]